MKARPELITVVIEIGNTDHRLSAPEWSALVEAVSREIFQRSEQFHCHRTTLSPMGTHRIAWAVSCIPGEASHLRRAVTSLGRRFWKEPAPGMARGRAARPGRP